VNKDVHISKQPTTTFCHTTATNKEHLSTEQIIIRCLESAFHQLWYLKFSFKLVDFSKSYVRKQKQGFFGTHCTLCITTSAAVSVVFTAKPPKRDKQCLVILYDRTYHAS